MSKYDLAEAKVGDEVAVCGGFGRDTKLIVTRTTTTRVILDDGTAWTRRGFKVGSARVDSAGARFRQRAQPWDEERHQELMKERAHKRLIREVEDLRFMNLSFDQLTRIKDIANEPKEAPATTPESAE